MNRTKHPKLSLRRESLRQLAGNDLERAAGGVLTQTCPTISDQSCQNCPIVDRGAWAINPAPRLIDHLPDLARIQIRSRGL